MAEFSPSSRESKLTSETKKLKPENSVIKSFIVGATDLLSIRVFFSSVDQDCWSVNQNTQYYLFIIFGSWQTSQFIKKKKKSRNIGRNVQLDRKIGRSNIYFELFRL